MFDNILYFYEMFKSDELLELLGEGSFGKVRKAVHLSTGNTYAIKIMDVELDKKRKIADMEQMNFLRLQGSSPYLVNIIECFEEVW
jgi:serine/threonine protein kinase